ncbi:TPA: hypothetical protein WI034_001505 [Neisseria meningitidis]
MDKQQFKTSSFSYTLNKKGNYDVVKHHYGLGICQEWRKNVYIPEHLIEGLIRKPHSGYFNQEIEKLVK